MKELFIDKLVFRWDFLHLIPKDAKGTVSDVEHDNELSEYEDESDKKGTKNENNTLITEQTTVRKMQKSC